MGEGSPLRGLIQRELRMFPDPCLDDEKKPTPKKDEPADWTVVGRDPESERDRQEQRERIDRATRHGAGLS